MRKKQSILEWRFLDDEDGRPLREGHSALDWQRLDREGNRLVSGTSAALDWQMLDHREWEAGQWPIAAFEPEDALPHESGRRRWRRLARNLVLVTLLAVLVTGYWVWRLYQDGIARIRADIGTTIELEGWAWQREDEMLSGNLIDKQAPATWSNWFLRSQQWMRRWAGDAAQIPVIEIQDVMLRDDVALVEVVVTQPGVPWATSPYRETRFYRLVNRRWLRTAPDESFWGEPQTIGTKHFRFEFRQRDAEAVQAVAAEIEDLYTALRRDVGLGPPPASEYLTVEVLPRIDLRSWRFIEDRLKVPSPALVPVPVELPNAVRLSQSIRWPLTWRVLEEALQQFPIEAQWRPVVEGLRLWLGSTNDTLPSAWRYDAEGRLREGLAEYWPVRLTDLNTRWDGPSLRDQLNQLPSHADLNTRWNRWNWLSRQVENVLAETVITYAVTIYGHERLPALLRGLSEHGTWETLIPAVFGVPADDFEAGWQAYLAARYEVQTELY